MPFEKKKARQGTLEAASSNVCWLMSPKASSNHCDIKLGFTELSKKYVACLLMFFNFFVLFV